MHLGMRVHQVPGKKGEGESGKVINNRRGSPQSLSGEDRLLFFHRTSPLLHFLFFFLLFFGLRTYVHECLAYRISPSILFGVYYDYIRLYSTSLYSVHCHVSPVSPRTRGMLHVKGRAAN